MCTLSVYYVYIMCILFNIYIYYTILYYIILYYIIWYYIILYYVILYCIIWYYIILHYIILYIYIYIYSKAIKKPIFHLHSSSLSRSNTSSAVANSFQAATFSFFWTIFWSDYIQVSDLSNLIITDSGFKLHKYRCRNISPVHMVGQCRQPQQITCHHQLSPKKIAHGFSLHRVFDHWMPRVHYFEGDLWPGPKRETGFLGIHKIDQNLEGPKPDARSTMCWALDIHCSQHCLPWYRSTFFGFERKAFLLWFLIQLESFPIWWLPESNGIGSLETTTLNCMLGLTPRKVLAANRLLYSILNLIDPNKFRNPLTNGEQKHAKVMNNTG